MKARKILNDSSIVGPDSVFAAITPFPLPEILMVSLVQMGWVLSWSCKGSPLMEVVAQLLLDRTRDPYLDLKYPLLAERTDHRDFGAALVWAIQAIDAQAINVVRGKAQVEVAV